MKHLSFLTAFIFSCISLLAQFETGDRVQVSETFPDDLYMAGGEVSVDAPVYGDAVLAGGTINVNDSVMSDLTVAGGQIKIRGYVGDDVRAAGGSIEIDSDVMDDLIVFGGEVRVGRNATIHGNIVSYGGQITVDGTVIGALQIGGGDLSVSGTVHGPASLAAGSLQIGSNAEFLSTVNYWSEEGEMEFGGSVRNGEAVYDESLAWEGNDYADPGTIFGISLFFMIFFLLGGYLFILALEWAFGSWFSKAADQILKGWSTSLGAGVIYLIGVPVLVLISILIIIGIPIGLLVVVLYFFSLLFGNLVAGLVFTHLWKAKKGKSWSFMLTGLIALGISIILHILTSIPFLGALISFMILGISYGAIIMAIRAKKSGSIGQHLTQPSPQLG